MFRTKKNELNKTTKDWRLTIFGDAIHTPKEMLPLNHPDSPHYERFKAEKQKQNGAKK